MTRLTLPSYAKVNLYLDIVGRYPDGYHQLVTLFERIDLSDELTMETVRGDRVDFFCDHPDVPTDTSNLVVRAVEKYRQASGWDAGLRITLKKRIPVGAGLGGGSSNAASALKGANILAGNLLPEGELSGIAGRLGADVSFFWSHRAWALGTGKGDRIEPVSISARLWHLLVYPSVLIPTRQVYEAFSVSDGLARSLTASKPDVKLLVDALRDNQQVPKIRRFLFNALEPTVEALYPALQHVKQTIQTKAELSNPLISGSGSTVMALCGSREESEKAAWAIRQAEPGWGVFVASTRS
ncbi:MAG: 4-(cytidine 5'-diphospho)-2-C-methyl-D-erythritol kinase [Candidatus Omnitrophica bacterium]|nr:4-(cytidine 5'-diphospho)-2-C-methyl-D-erythritol kinase [Candidatus Omnitrophota bacterium]